MLRSTTRPFKSACDFSAPSAAWKVKSCSASGVLRTTKAAMGPVLSPCSALEPPPSPAGAAVWAGASGAEPDRKAWSEGAKLQYTVPNPAIAASAAAIQYLVGDAACLRLFVEFTSSSFQLPALSVDDHDQHHVGRPLCRKSCGDHGGDKCLHRLRQALVAARHRGVQGPCRHAWRHRHRRARGGRAWRHG